MAKKMWIELESVALELAAIGNWQAFNRIVMATLTKEFENPAGGHRHSPTCESGFAAKIETWSRALCWDAENVARLQREIGRDTSSQAAQWSQ